jgi:hypothetical protein
MLFDPDLSQLLLLSPPLNQLTSLRLLLVYCIVDHSASHNCIFLPWNAFKSSACICQNLSILCLRRKRRLQRIFAPVGAINACRHWAFCMNVLIFNTTCISKLYILRINYENTHLCNTHLLFFDREIACRFPTWKHYCSSIYRTLSRLPIFKSIRYWPRAIAHLR